MKLYNTISGKILQHKLIVFVVIIYLLQFFLILNKRIVYDECWVAVPVYQFFENHGFWVNSVHNLNQPTSTYQFTNYQLLLLAIHLFLPDSIIYSRMINIIIVPAIIIVVYLLSLRIFRDKYWAVIPPLLLAVDNIFFITSFIVRPDIVLALGVPLILLLLYDDEWHFRRKYLIISGILSGIITGMHPNFILFIIAFFIAYIIWEARNISLKDNLIILGKFLFGVSILIIPIAIYIVISQSNYHTKIINYIFEYVQKTTTIDSESTILNPAKLLSEEMRRYNEFLQGNTRIHFLVVFFVAIFLSIRIKEKIIKILATTTFLIIILFTLLIANKNVRYLAIILPSVSILTTWVLFDLKAKLKTSYKKKLVAAFLVILIGNSFAGNIYFIIKRWDTNYLRLQNSLMLKYDRRTIILGDLVLWDIFKNSNYISFMSDYKYIRNQRFDYVITGGKPTIQDDTRNKFYKYIFPKLKTQYLREYKNSYYGNFKIYKVLR